MTHLGPFAALAAADPRHPERLSAGVTEHLVLRFKPRAWPSSLLPSQRLPVPLPDPWSA